MPKICLSHTLVVWGQGHGNVHDLFNGPPDGTRYVLSLEVCIWCSHTVQYVRAVGRDVSPGKCVLLSSSRAVRKRMKLWDVSGDGRSWSAGCLGSLWSSGLHQQGLGWESLKKGQGCYLWCCGGWCAASWVSGHAGPGSWEVSASWVACSRSVVRVCLLPWCLSCC